MLAPQPVQRVSALGGLWLVSVEQHLRARPAPPALAALPPRVPAGRRAL